MPDQPSSLEVQIPLSIHMREKTTFENYSPGDNQEAVEALRACAQGDSESRQIYLWGDPGMGKSHLLQAAALAAQSLGRRAFYLPLQELQQQAKHQTGSDILQNYGNADLICIDDIHSVQGIGHWEEAVFTLFNQIHEGQRSFISSANRPPAELKLTLDDLGSRLGWGGVYRLYPLEEKQRLAALCQRAEERGFGISLKAGNYLMKHYPRDMHTLFRMLDKLDKASLAAKNRITIPFIKKVLG